MRLTQTKKVNREQIVLLKGEKNSLREEKKFFMFIVYTKLINSIYQIGEISSLGKICLLPLHTILNDPKKSIKPIS